MTRFLLPLTLSALTTLTPLAPATAQGFDGPRAPFALTGEMPEAAERACFGPTGRLMPCRRTAPLR
jgi:hypothetical protein